LKLSSVIQIVALWGSCLLCSCNYLQVKEPAEATEEVRQPVARVGQQFLYKEDLIGVAEGTNTAGDSVARVKRYVDNWVRKQLMIAEAAENVDFDKANLERKILDYRYALMVYEYEKLYTSQNLDTAVSAQDIQAYYNQNLSQFKLRENILKGLFITLPQEAPTLRKVKRWVKSDKPEDRAALRNYCYQFATNYLLEDSVWVRFNDVALGTPLAATQDKVVFLQQNDFVELKDDNFIYLLRIIDYKVSDQESPLQFVKDLIRDIIINKRRVALAQALEDDVYEKARNNKEFEVY